MNSTTPEEAWQAFAELDAAAQSKQPPAYTFREGEQEIAFAFGRPSDVNPEDGAILCESCVSLPQEREFPLYADDLEGLRNLEPILCELCNKELAATLEPAARLEAESGDDPVDILRGSLCAAYNAGATRHPGATVAEDADGPNAHLPHICNGVEGGERHGFQNRCTQCGEYRSGRHVIVAEGEAGKATPLPSSYELAVKVADGLLANGYLVVHRDGEKEPVDQDAVIECIGCDLYGPLSHCRPSIERSKAWDEYQRFVRPTCPTCHSVIGKAMAKKLSRILVAEHGLVGGEK